MAKVFKSMPLDSSRRQRQHRVKAIEGLNRSFLVDAKHRRMRWRVEVQPNDVGRLSFKLRVIRGHVALHSMRFEPMLSPYSSHHHVMRTQLLSQLPGAPMRGSIARCLPSAFQNARLQFRRERAQLTAFVPAVQPRQALGLKALTPARHETVVAIELIANLSPTRTFGQHQNAARSARLFCANRAPSGAFVQFHSFGFGQYHAASYASL